MLFSIQRTFTVAVVLFLSLLAKPVFADTFICENGLFFLGSSDIVDNVLIRNGGALLIDGGVVAGDIEIEQGGVLAASSALIGGDVEADRASVVDLSNCQIDGEVELKRTSGSANVSGFVFPPSVDIFFCKVAKSVEVTRSDVNSLNVFNNTIGGKLKMSRNRSKFPIVVENNIVGGNNDCD